ncbi:MAG: hypothetical protein COA52_14960 [Hyphomicrobiales bacterium]|nr:MAG: hypothetical protein COA52_14960 [Hyphomicrobiales bacterium]
MNIVGSSGSGKILGAVAIVAAMLASPAVAADLPIYTYDEPVYEKAGAWYLRGDIGYVATANYEVSFDGVPGHQELTNEDWSNTWLIGIGVGYEFNHYFRMDLTLDYTATWEFEGNSVCLSNACGGLNNEFGSMAMYTVLGNAYLDWDNSSAFTPYIGGGLGFAYVDVRRHYSHNFDNTSNGFAAEGNWNFAAAAMVGLTYDVTENFKLDANYRYLWVGDVESGDEDASALVGKITYEDLDFHQIRVGGRYTFH